MLELFEEEEVVDVLEMSWKRRSKGVGDVAHASSSAGGGGGGGGAGGVGEREVFLRGLEEGERDCEFFFPFFSVFLFILMWFGGGGGVGSGGTKGEKGGGGGVFLWLIWANELGGGL